MTILTWSGFSKRRNSTLQPTGGTSVTATLKEDCSIDNPVFILTSSDTTINYIQAFGTYYFVTNLVFLANNLLEIHCEKDVLATYKSDIASTSAYILYATGGYNTIIDTRIPMKSGITMTVPATASFPWTVDPSNGRYLLTAMSKYGVRTYNMSYIQLIALLSDLANWTDDLFNNIPSPDWTQITEIVTWQTKVVWSALQQFLSFKDASECLVDCTWIPINYVSGVSDRIYLGNYDTGVDANYMNNEVHTKTVSLTIPWAYSDWRNNSPYCQMYLYIPFVGNISIDPSIIIGQSTITCKFALARCSGDCSVEISAGNIIIGTYGVNLSAKYPVGAMQSDPIRQVTSVIAGAVTTIGGIASGNVPVALGGAAALGLSSSNFVPQPSTIGGLGGGSGSGLDADLKLVVLYHDTIEAPGASNATIGKPVMSTHTISNYSGYIQCSNASIAISGESGDKDAVNSFLNGGFYYE